MIKQFSFSHTYCKIFSFLFHPFYFLPSFIFSVIVEGGEIGSLGLRLRLSL